mmetsp:Transcript_7940/g.22868  ORF Transcript_7940/g.22868 Transcript_7940/m.22868 type:complete len:202 (+) Transcript_7940:273-878(+)
MMSVIRFRIRSVNPIKDVQSSVCAHEENVIPGQILNFLVSLQDDQLRQDGDRFQVNAEGPQQLNDIEIGNTTADHVRDDGNDGARCHRKLPVQEGILRLVVGGFDWLFELDGVNDGCRGSNVHDLHDGIVEGIKSEEQIQVPSHEDAQEELMRSHGDALCISCHAQPQKQHDDAEEMRHVAEKPKDIHGFSGGCCLCCWLR